MNQKDEEILILNSFIKNYDTSIRVVTKEEAIKIFPHYTWENPDFIIHKNEYIGIELFRLVLTNNDNMFLRKKKNV